MTARLSGWGGLLASGGALAILIYLYLAFFVPGTLALSPFTIQDDARQFQLWMPRLADGRLLAGDWMADYWRAVSPPVYRAPFIAAAALGIDPLLLGRIVPAILLAVSLWAGWRLALKVCGRPRVAFFAAAFLFAYLLHDDSVFSATPRAFSAPLLLLALNAMLAGRTWLALALVTLLAAIYPTTAIAAYAIFGLRQLRIGGPLGLTLPLRALTPLAAGLAAIVLMALPLSRESASWGPVVTLEQAMDLPNMNRPEGRSSIVDADGDIAWICSARMGFLPEAVPCGWGIPGAAPINALLLLPLIVLAVRSARGRPGPETAERNRLYLHALIACTVCFAAAALVAFNLHFSGRYTQRVLGPLEWLAIGQVLGTWLEARARAWSGAVLALLAALFVTPLPGFVRPDPGLIRAVRALPPGARIAGVAEELGSIPALTGRAIAAAPEQAIPWHMGYYRRFERGLILSLAAVTAPDSAGVARALSGSGSSYLLVDRRTLEAGVLPERYGQIVPGAVRMADAALAAGPSAVQRLAPVCTVYSGPEASLLSGACLARGGR
ncbi:MAG: hypothetical protein B7Z08_00155 [Sphingomonadales bacterium 32-68-7]|nr:MAG: hypothetical protein B7Z33_09410 [Sphingomonadales bacterium 12-68-11]OYX10548.1 MAG: hypothetical protein B7Z08_00155 [Sphingomonadales bacterium 32-68-7]